MDPILRNASFQEVLAVLFRAMNYRSYLELGVGDGSMVRKIHPLAALTVAVDVRLTALPAGVRGYEMTTQEFFASRERPSSFDMIFVDADHAHQSVRSDLWNSLAILSPEGTVALHDTDPSEHRFLHPTHCNDAYRIVDDLAARDDLTAVTLPVGHEGLTLVRPRRARRVLRFPSGASP